YTRPFASASPLPCEKVAASSPVENSSLPVVPSSAYIVACDAIFSLSAAVYGLPFFLARRGDSPVERANTNPFVVIGDAGASKSREIHCGTSDGFPFFASTLNATMLPCGAAPFVTANLAASPAGPDNAA